MVTYRERQVCGSCEGKGIINRVEPQPGKWFQKMGLTYQPGLEFTVLSGERDDTVVYGSEVTDSGLSDGDELAWSYNEKLSQDTAPQTPCCRCMGVGTIPKPLERDEQMYDRGELMAEAAAAGGMQGYSDMQDEWSEYVTQTGAYADPFQRQVLAQWNNYQSRGRSEELYG